MAEIGKDIDYAKDVLSDGGIVGVPTETVYGLAGSALDTGAILKIYKAKNRPQFDPLIAHTNRIDKIETWVHDFPLKAMQLAEKFWPGPLTLLLNKTDAIPDLLTSGLARVAFRIPNHPLTLELLSRLDFPLAAPSANPFGFVSPTQASHVEDQLGDKVDYILNGGKCRIGIESTVVGFEEDEVIVHRLGGLSVEEIEEVVGPVQLKLNKSSNPEAPGMMKSHYSPGIPVIIGSIRDEVEKLKDRKAGVISFSEFYHDAQVMKVLSPTRDLHQAAKNLFRVLREMKDEEVDVIVTEKFPNEGLGKAINDRLERSAAS
ncbi:MAG: threonylcarbamoyl-AMP synthase [Cytophagales bacterium]|nr:threonylcarbamoyl-AMP synthase [Cytophagales bacterium]